ncbi:MAG: aspartate/glutamate racemase family protein [Chloroflexaceae bacterium]
MKTIGLIGGMSWESSLEYYRIINEQVKHRCGGLHSARSLMYSVDFAEIETLQQQARWDAAAMILADAARRLERGGADLLVLCTNTMHKVADAIAGAVSIPLLHIADPTAEAVRAAGLRTVGLLGTRFTMEQAFYKGRLTEQHGLTVLVPEDTERETIHRIIYEELCLGIIQPEARAAYLRIMERLQAAGAQGIILGCTEIGLLIKAEDSRLPLFDTTRLHAEAAVAYALGLG